MIYSVTIALGFVRLSLLVLVLFYLNRKFINYRKPENIFDFIANQWFKYGSILVILLFALVQLKIYNLFNTLIIFFFLVTIDYIGLKKLKIALTFSSKKVRKKTFELIKNIELKKDWSYYITTKTDKSVRKKRLWLMFLLFIIGFITFFSRYYFTKYDVYALSNLWIMELEQVVEFNKQNWFLNGVAPVGELAIINFYSKISSISPEIALESMGIIESVLIGILIFWTISKITTSKIIAPIVASLFFALCYVLSPINISYILQHKPMFLALSLAIPGMVFYLNPSLLKFNKKNYYYNFIFAFVAIGLVDIFTLLLILLPFVVIGFIFSKKDFIAHKLIALKAFIVSIVLLLLIYGTSCYLMGYDFEVFLNSSLIAPSSYTYFPHLVMSYNVLMSYYIVFSLAIILILLILTYGFKENWHEAFTFLFLFILLILLSNVKNEWIDNETLKQALAIFIPILIGISVGLLSRLTFPIYKKIQFLTPYFAGILVASICFVAFYFQLPEFSKLKQSDTTARKILDAYENISSEFFPFSYSVVNDYSTHSISTNQHFFVNYEDFLKDYLNKDYQYFKHNKEIKYLQSHPEIILPKSVIVFLYKQKATKLESLVHSYNLSSKLKLQLEALKNRGRTINIIYSNEIFDVYEIINVPNEARVKNLIFKI
jgi:hypothetical protein